MTTTDLLIIGSGPGGYRTAEYAAKKGLKVIVVEQGNAGGTCLNCGCIPTKTLVRHAMLVDDLREAETYGLEGLTYQLNFEKIRDRKQKVVEQLRSGVEQLLSQPGIQLVRGKAVFQDAKTVVVGDETFTAKNIIIATGSTAKILNVEGKDLPGVIDAERLLDIDHVPECLCVIGAGVMGMEFASVFNAFGSKVTVVEFLKECLPALDSDIAKRLRKTLERKGVSFSFQSGVTKIERTDNGLLVSYEKKGKTFTVEADTVLMSTGHAPRVEGYGLENTGVDYDRKGIKVDDNMETNVPGIYAIGDVNARMMVAHVATFQGFRAVNHILGITDHIRFDIIPAGIFTNPEAASVGKSEDQCKAEGLDYVCHKGFYRSNGKALAFNETEGMVKIMTDADDKIIGCHIFGAHATDLVQEICCLMNKDTTLSELGQMIHTHPTLEEILQDMAC